LFDILGLPSELPGVFKGLPFSSTVNGSLWTLPYEVWLYVSIAVLALLGIAERRRLFASIAGIFVGLFLANEALGFASRYPFVPFFLRFTGLFYLGSAFALYGARMLLSWKVLAVATVALILARLFGFYDVLFPLYTVYFVFVMAFLVKGPILNYNRLGDYSYGMYIYAYPLQQSLLVLFPGINPLKHFITSLACTVPMAVLSWHLVERPALSLKDKQVEFPR
jgi:peptidoglycan/LPS O-acetylase OafA/YrhL